ncbi:MAG: hypothetical protein EZS28_013715 [Streblomastix strix]|uniref:SPRY domain-containing protein n=1 Tax=Streblomastix strix TaxID=222440 RepID=A0A5J4W8U3_9EUKA|nr:MAG: hypothetical protein EZS28_013715 [Streblomastix strix]
MELSITILRLIGSSEEDLSRAGSYALCNIINSDEIVQMALLQKRFVNLFIENLSIAEEMKSQSSSSSSSSSPSIQLEIPIFVQIGLLNIIMKLVEVEADLIQINPFISIVQQLRIHAQNEELKQKANKILDLFSKKHQTNKSNKPKTQNEQIAELESKKVWLQQQLTNEREEQERLSVELIRICEQKEIHQREKERERSIRLRTQGEIRRIKEDQKRQKELFNRQQLQLQLPVEQEFTTVGFSIIPKHGPFLCDPKTQTFTNGTNPTVGIFEGNSNIDSYNDPHPPNKFLIDKLLFNSKGEVWQHRNCSREKNSPMKKGDIVSLIVNMNKSRTIHLYINSIEQPFGLHNTDDSISILSLKKMNIQPLQGIPGQKRLTQLQNEKEQLEKVEKIVEREKPLNILNTLNSQETITPSFDSTKEKDEKIRQLEESYRHLEESNKLKDEEIQRKDEESAALKAENSILKKEIEKIKLEYPQDRNISIHNPDPDDIELSDVDVTMKRISKKQTKNNTVSLTQVLEDGIWQLETWFNNSNNADAGIGIVQDSYEIPARTNPTSVPHTQNMAIFLGKQWDNQLFFNGIGTKGMCGFGDNQILRLEFDSKKGTLFLFVDNIQQELYISGIKEKVRFIV